MSADSTQADVLGLTAQIVAAQVSRSATPAEALPSLILEVYRTLTNIGRDTTAPEKPTPAVPVKKSIFSDHIICLEDGKKLKMLKRHLMTSFGLTPDQYRSRWGLPADYPMVAPEYAAHRSSLAKKIGLGTKPRRRA